MFRRSLQVLPLALALAFPVACTEDTVSFDPQSVPPDKQIDELDPMEQESFCEEATDWAQEFVESSLPKLICRAEGLSAAATESGIDAGACREAEKACLANPPEEAEIETGELTCNVDDLGAECDVTVREFADCLEEAVEINDRFLSEFTCDKFASGDFPNEADLELSAGCQTLFDKCGSTDMATDMTMGG
jgi:hypothetical protein